MKSSKLLKSFLLLGFIGSVAGHIHPTGAIAEAAAAAVDAQVQGCDAYIESVQYVPSSRGIYGYTLRVKVQSAALLQNLDYAAAFGRRLALPAHPYPGDVNSTWREFVLSSSGDGVFEGSSVELSGWICREDFEFALFLATKDGKHLWLNRDGVVGRNYSIESFPQVSGSTTDEAVLRFLNPRGCQ
jgi:hypothetical protein